MLKHDNGNIEFTISDKNVGEKDIAEVRYEINPNGETTVWFDLNANNDDYEGSVSGINTEQVKAAINKLFPEVFTADNEKVGLNLFEQVNGSSWYKTTIKKVNAITPDNAIDAIRKFNELSPDKHITRRLYEEYFMSPNTLLTPARKLLEKFKDDASVNTTEEYNKLKKAVNDFPTLLTAEEKFFAQSQVITIDNAIDALIKKILK